MPKKKNSAAPRTRRDNNEGSIFYDNNKQKWCAKLRTGTYNASGNEKVKTKLFTYKTDAKKWLAQQRDLKARGELDFATTGGITLAVLSAQINNEKKALNKIKDSTYARNENTIIALKKSKIAYIPIQKINEQDIINYYSSILSYSQSYVDKQVRCVRQAYRYALKKGLIKKDIAADISLPKSKKKTKKVLALDLEQQRQVSEKIRTEIKEPYSSMLLLMMFTGLRPGEVSALHYSDINLFKKTITVKRGIMRTRSGKLYIGEPKTAAGIRTVPLSSEAFKVIRNYYKNNNKHSGLVFKGKNKNRGELISVNTTNEEFKKIAPAAQYTQYCLRHTFATRCIESGMNVKVLSKLLGHSSIKITLDTYCDVFEKYSNDSVSKLDEYLKEQKLVENL
jgi:integrase